MSGSNIGRLEKRRAKAALTCAKKMRDAAAGISAYLGACNELRDGSHSLSSQGKGVDSRETMIRDLSEYAGWLEDKYGGAA